jgi:hypothetical protein
MPSSLAFVHIIKRRRVRSVKIIIEPCKIEEAHLRAEPEASQDAPRSAKAKK